MSRISPPCSSRTSPRGSRPHRACGVGLEKASLSRLWLLVVFVSALASLAGYAFLDTASGDVVAFVQSFAGGAILTMLADTMMPEGFEYGGKGVGVLTTLGFIFAYGLHVAV